MHATGNKSLVVYKNAEDNYKYIVELSDDKIEEDYNKIAKAEIRGSLINLSIVKEDDVDAKDVAYKIVDNFKSNWNVNIKTIVEYKNEDDTEYKKLNLKEIINTKKA